MSQRLQLPARGVRVNSRSVVAVRAQLQTEVKPAEAQTSSSEKGEEIYIGFAKGDYAPRAGRKGRVIKDDPRKYPGKEDVGIFSGATGGWAGGEVGLWQLREEVAANKGASSKSGDAPKAASKPAPAAGKDLIYVGYSKDELELRKSGAPGRFIVDDAQKYPAKEDLGPLMGATGGFAAGEVGLKQFVETGEVKIRGPNDPPRQQFSPVSLGFLLVFAGGFGGLALNGVTDAGEELVKGNLMAAPIDDNTKTLIIAALALLGSAGAVGAARAAISSFNERMREGATNLVTIGAFGIVLFIAARAVLEL